MIAALEGRTGIVSALLDIGADVEARDWVRCLVLQHELDVHILLQH